MIKLLSRIYMFSTFLWALVYLIWKYTNVTVIEETKVSMPIPILIVLFLMISVIVFGGFVVLLITWIDKIKDDKFSIYTALPIFILLLGTIGLAKLGIHKLKVLIELNAERFITDLQGYNQSMTIVLLILLSGLVIGTVGHIYSTRP